MKARRPTRAAHLLRRAREQKGWSREYLAKLLDTNTFTVYRWESGRAFPRFHYRQKLAELFACDLDQLGLVMEPSTHITPSQESGLSEPEQESVPEMSISMRSSFPPPANPIGLVGREDFLRALKTRVCQGKVLAALALHGLPGIGKTALAVALAYDEEIQQQFPGGILWASLGPHPDVLMLLRSWASSLGFAPTTLASFNDCASLGQAIQATIRTRKMLLIIDDAWQIDDAFALKVGGPYCSSLLTTRYPLLAAQYAPHEVFVVPELAAEDGLKLLEQLAPAVAALERDLVRQLVDMVGGLPFALVLMGRYLYLQSISQQPRRMRAAIARLRQREERLNLSLPRPPTDVSPSLSKGVSPSLRAAFAMNEERLSQAARDLLGALSVFMPKPNTFSEEAAFAVGGLEPGLFFTALDELYDAGLVESRVPNRYTLHQTVADLAQLQGSHTEAQKRLALYMVDYLEAHQRDYGALDLEFSNVLAALESASHLGLQALLVRGVSHWWPYLDARGLYDLAERQLVRAQQAASGLEDQAGLTTILLYLELTVQRRAAYARA